MKTKDLVRLGVPLGEPIERAQEFIKNYVHQGYETAMLEDEIFSIVANPTAFFSDPLRAPPLRNRRDRRGSIPRIRRRLTAHGRFGYRSNSGRRLSSTC